MDIGLLILRAGLAVLLAGHGAQKMVGAFGGLGPAGTAPIFESWGLRPGLLLVRLAAATELVAAALLLLGLLAPLGAVMAIGAMGVAVSVTAANGLWAQKGGCELPLTYGGIAAALAFTGPGALSVDAAAGLTGRSGPLWGLVAIVIGLVPAVALALYASRNRARAGV